MDLAPHRSTRARMALCAALPVLWLALVVAGPAHAQTNSPSGGQSTGNTPSQGGPSGDTGSNTGGDGTAGNRSTPGGGGATGGGSSGGATEDTSGASNAGPIVGVVLLLGAVLVGIAVATRHRRVEDVEAGTSSAR